MPIPFDTRCLLSLHLPSCSVLTILVLRPHRLGTLCSHVIVPFLVMLATTRQKTWLLSLRTTGLISVSATVFPWIVMSPLITTRVRLFAFRFSLLQYYIFFSSIYFNSLLDCLHVRYNLQALPRTSVLLNSNPNPYHNSNSNSYLSVTPSTGMIIRQWVHGGHFVILHSKL